MTRRVRAPITGARTAWPASPTTSNGSASPSRSGTGRIPILKERAVRPDQQRGQSRRGRQGVLLLPRQHADALLHEVSLQVSAGRLSRMIRLVADQSRPQPPGIRVRTDQHGRLRRGPLLRRVRGIRQGIARGHPGSNQRPQSRSGARGDSRAADALVPQSLVVGPGQSAAHRCKRSRARPPW